MHPTFIVGPTLINEENSSIAGFAKYMRNEVPGVPKLCFPVVDVRDVALAHCLALEKPGLSGERILLNKESWWFADMVNVFKDEFSQYGYKIKTKSIGYCSLRIAAFFMSQVKIILPLLN